MALLGNLLRVLHQLRKHLHCQSLSSQLSPEGAGFCNVWAALRKLVSQTELSLNLTLYFPEIQLQEGGSHWECLLWNLKKLNSNFHCNHWTAFVHVRFQGLWVHSCCWHLGNSLDVSSYFKTVAYHTLSPFLYSVECAVGAAQRGMCVEWVFSEPCWAELPFHMPWWCCPACVPPGALLLHCSKPAEGTGC